MGGVLHAVHSILMHLMTASLISPWNNGEMPFFEFAAFLTPWDPHTDADRPLHHPTSSKLHLDPSISCWRKMSPDHGEVEAMEWVILCTFECILGEITGVGPVWDIYI